jgi:hypothetical protein
MQVGRKRARPRKLHEVGTMSGRGNGRDQSRLGTARLIILCR